MLDFWWIASRALWILGLSVLLASWSFGYYDAQVSGRRVRDVLSSPSYDLAITVGLTLFTLGLAATDDRLWASLLWIILSVAIVASYAGRRQRRS